MERDVPDDAVKSKTRKVIIGGRQYTVQDAATHPSLRASNVPARNGRASVNRGRNFRDRLSKLTRDDLSHK